MEDSNGSKKQGRQWKKRSLTRRPRKSQKNFHNTPHRYRMADENGTEAEMAVAEEEKQNQSTRSIRSNRTKRSWAFLLEEEEVADEVMEEVFTVEAAGVDRRGNNRFAVEQLRARRMAMYYYFTQVYGAPREESGLWDGKDGIAAAIRDHLLLPLSTDLRSIYTTFRTIQLYEEKNYKYLGDARPRKEWQHYLIPLDSYEASLIADLIEGDFGFTEATDLVNEYRTDCGVVTVGRSCVYQTSKRMNPTISKIKKRQQGSLDLNSGWCRASHRWATQLLIMFREDITVPEQFYKEGKLPQCYNLDDIPKVDIRCVDWWDETHKKQRVGKVKNGSKLEYRFPRSEGSLDLESGTIKDAGFSFHMKYEKEARFMLGMRLDVDGQTGEVRKDDGGKCLGTRLPLFEYTEKNIVSDADWNKIFREVMVEPKTYKGVTARKWICNPREEGVTYKGDPVTTLKGIGTKAEGWLKDHNINTVLDYYNYFYCRPARRKNFCKQTKTSVEVQLKAEAQAESAQVGPPASVDHRESRNPYFSRYGKNRWKGEVEKHPKLRKVVNVRELVKHIYNTGKNYYEHTIFKDTWRFYHDALSLMTSKANMDWMKSQGYLDRWILPLHDLTSDITHYRNPRPIGNHAGAMPWDSSCNKDLDDIVLRHVAATYRLPRDDPRKFSLATPKHVSSAYRRIYNNPPVQRDGEDLVPLGCGGPPPARLGQDIMKVPKYWRGVLEAKGLNTETNVKGQRGDEARGTAKRGGRRIKKEDERTKWYHPDARESLDEFLEESQETFEKQLEKTREKFGTMTKKDDPAQNPDAFESVEIQEDDIAEQDQEMNSDSDSESIEEEYFVL